MGLKFLAIGCRFKDIKTFDSNLSNLEALELFCDSDVDISSDYCLPGTSFVKFSCKDGFTTGYKLKSAGFID